MLDIQSYKLSTTLNTNFKLKINSFKLPLNSKKPQTLKCFNTFNNQLLNTSNPSPHVLSNFSTSHQKNYSTMVGRFKEKI